MDLLIQCRFFGDQAIIGSSHAVRFGTRHGVGGTLTEQGRRADLAVSGQTIVGLTEEVNAIGQQQCGALVFIGANDGKDLASAILEGRITLRKAEDTLRAAMMNIVRVLFRTFAGNVLCERIWSRWKRFGEEWYKATTRLEYAICRVLRQREVVFIPVNHLLGRKHHAKFIGRYYARDYVHLNTAGYAIVAQELGTYK